MAFAVSALPLPQGFTAQLTALNANGDAVGFGFPASGDLVGIVWPSGGSFVTVASPDQGQPGSGAIILVGINDQRDTAGWRGLYSDTQVAILALSGQQAQDFSTVTNFGAGSLFAAVNNAGILCGFAWYDALGNYNPQGFVYDSNKDSIIQVVPLLNTTQALPVAINQNGDVAGTSSNPNTYVVRGFVLQAVATRRPGAVGTPGAGGNVPPVTLYGEGNMIDLGDVDVYAINDSGQAAGTDGNVPLVWDYTTTPPDTTQLPLPTGYTGGGVIGINNAGAAVGFCGNAQGGSSCFFFDGARSHDLTALAAGGIVETPGWILTNVAGINDRGEIGANAWYPNPQLPVAEQEPNPVPILLKPTLRLRTRLPLPPAIGASLAAQPAGSGLGGQPVGAWGLQGTAWAALSPAKRDALTGLAIHQMALGVGDQAAREAIERAALDLVSSSVERLRTATPARQAGLARRVQAMLKATSRIQLLRLGAPRVGLS